MDTAQAIAHLEAAIGHVESVNGALEPELASEPDAKTFMALYARLGRLSSFGVAAFARREDALDVAKLTGTSMGKAKDLVATSAVLVSSGTLDSAMRCGDISLDQATEIARAEEAAPGAAEGLIEVAKGSSYQVFKEKARKTKLEAEQYKGLAKRQREARSGRSWSDELGMVQVHLALEPHVGVPITARAEAEAQRSARAATKAGVPGRFECHLADAYANLLSGAGTGRAKRPELVVLVSHEVAKRGWNDVREGELCKIPGLGPIAPSVARDIASDAFLNGVFYDGKDLRHFKRFGRASAVEIEVALELGASPEFDGVKCIDCGRRFRTQFDHLEPVAAGGPSALYNFGPRCDPCHKAKTERDRLAGKLKPNTKPKTARGGRTEQPKTKVAARRFRAKTPRSRRAGTVRANAP